MAESSQKQYHAPVETSSKIKWWLKRLGFILGSLILISILISSLFSSSSESSDKNAPLEPVTLDNLSAPQLLPEKESALRENEKTPVASNESIASREAENEAEKLEKMRLASPMNVYSNKGNASNVTPKNEAVLESRDTNTQFMQQLSLAKTATVQAGKIAHPATTLAQGTMIAAILETKIVSDLPGMIRAVTAEDIYAEEGSEILLPKGSRLIGQYTNAILKGQARVFVVWQRVIRPDFVDVALTSPGTDALGAAGISASHIDSHFWAQFGTATLLSVIGAGASNISVKDANRENAKTSYPEAIANSFQQSAENALENDRDIAPTLTIRQGTPINIFVARDLDFYDVLR